MGTPVNARRTVRRFYMLIYVAGPYRGNREENIARAREVAIELWKIGHAVICPHLNTSHLEDEGISDEVFIRGNLRIIARCDLIYVLKGWKASRGTEEEIAYSKSRTFPIPLWFEDEHPGEFPPLHLTEQRVPKQVDRFAELVMAMHRLHMSKSADYSPATILGTGMDGIVVRLWEKIARLMNLHGFPLRIEWVEREPNRIPQHEAIEDSLIDLANYAVIGLVLRQGDWGC